MDLNQIRKLFVGQIDKHAYEAELVKAIDVIIANKAFLIRSETVEGELRANEAHLASVKAEIESTLVVLKEKEAKVRDAKEYLDSGFKKKEAAIEKTLETLAEVKRKEINDDLNPEREELKRVRAEVTESKTELSDTKAKLRDLQKEISEMLVN